MHHAGEDRVPKRVADEREAAQDDEAADKAADEPDDDDFDERALHERVAERFGQPVHHANTAT